MAPFKAKMRQFASFLPPIRRLIAERDHLRKNNDELQRDVVAVTRELERIHAKFLAAWQQREELWSPPGHFYSPFPDILDLKLNEDEVFDPPPAIRGVRLNENGQLALLKQFAMFYPDQPFTRDPLPGRRYSFENPNYSYNDAVILYCMMRQARPRRIVEIGSGHSSCAMLDVNELFFDNSIACTFIDPFPQLLRDRIKESDQKRVRILGHRVQDVDLDVFRELSASDILFIDSSHVTKTGSDVNYIVFKILPLLEQGVLTHFHDIFYPFEYPKEWTFEGRGWNEAYLLRAFMQYNDAFEIEFFNSFLIEKHRDLFESTMPLCLRQPGANLWLKKIRRDWELERVAVRKTRKPPAVPKGLDLTRPEHASYLKKGWYEPEPDHCWMESSATFVIAGPVSQGQRLAIRAVSPLDGSTLKASADDIFLGSITFDRAGSVFPEFALPDVLIGRPSITVNLTIDSVHAATGDPRTLGLAVSRLEVR